MSQWIDVKKDLPEHGQRVLAFVPGNKVYLPGKSGEFELREVIVLHFQKDFFPHGTDKCAKHGPHFWQGEGSSNHYFADVSHWRTLPDKPIISS